MDTKSQSDYVTTQFLECQEPDARLPLPPNSRGPDLQGSAHATCAASETYLQCALTQESCLVLDLETPTWTPGDSQMSFRVHCLKLWKNNMKVAFLNISYSSVSVYLFLIFITALREKYYHPFNWWRNWGSVTCPNSQKKSVCLTSSPMHFCRCQDLCPFTQRVPLTQTKADSC